jgi:hypothetical protein
MDAKSLWVPPALQKELDADLRAEYDALVKRDGRALTCVPFDYLTRERCMRAVLHRG